MKRKLNKHVHTMAIVFAFALFLASVIGLHFAFPVVDTSTWTDPEAKRIMENNSNFFESIGHNVNNAWMNLQDLMKGDK